jgi:hypothetical protein
VLRWPALLPAILVYISLDFCLPAMPGAFVFEPAESVETVRLDRSHADVEALVTLPLARIPLVPPLLVERTNALALRREATPVVRPPIGHLPRAALGSARPTEDSH